MAIPLEQIQAIVAAAVEAAMRARPEQGGAVEGRGGQGRRALDERFFRRVKTFIGEEAG